MCFLAVLLCDLYSYLSITLAGLNVFLAVSLPSCIFRLLSTSSATPSRHLIYHLKARCVIVRIRMGYSHYQDLVTCSSYLRARHML